MKTLSTQPGNQQAGQRVRAPGIQPGETTVTIEGRQVPRLPHERDESGSSQKGPHDEVIQQAARDLKAGQLDTSMGPPMDDTYHRIVHDQPKRVPARKASTAAK